MYVSDRLTILPHSQATNKLSCHSITSIFMNFVIRLNFFIFQKHNKNFTEILNIFFKQMSASTHKEQIYDNTELSVALAYHNYQR